MTLDSENAIEKNNHFKRTQLVVDTEEPYHIYNYKIAIHSQIHDFGWDKTRYFLPNKKDNFDFDLLKYDFNAGKYYRYYTKEEIEESKSIGIIKKNKTPERIEIFSPKPVKTFEIEKIKKKRNKLQKKQEKKVEAKKVEAKKVEAKKVEAKKVEENPNNKSTVNIKIKKRSFCCCTQ